MLAPPWQFLGEGQPLVSSYSSRLLLFFRHRVQFQGPSKAHVTQLVLPCQSLSLLPGLSGYQSLSSSTMGVGHLSGLPQGEGSCP